MLAQASFSSFDTITLGMAPMQQQQQHTAQVAEKVMRRIEIAKVARNLQDCLAFASFKAQNGWQDRTLSTIEPEITKKLARRKRPYPEDLHSSDSATTFSDDHIPASSQPSYTVDPAQSYTDSRKRVRAASSSGVERTSHIQWGETAQVGQETPGHARSNTITSAYPALQDSPMFDAPSASEDEEQEKTIPQMQEPSSSIISSSPPRTPPPAARRHPGNTKQAGADLLLYLANSPRSPAVHVQHISSTSKGMPSTPPHQHADIPSSGIQTPGNFGLFNGTLHTPGNFNLADFCNVTPSPAQAQFHRHGTPALGRTPCRSTRRSLNFDALVPPPPSEQRKESQGLALELGDELARQ